MSAPPDETPPEREDDNDKKIRRQNFIVLIVVVLLVAASVFLVSELRKSALLERCIEARRHDCVPSEIAEPHQS